MFALLGAADDDGGLTVAAEQAVTTGVVDIEAGVGDGMSCQGLGLNASKGLGEVIEARERRTLLKK